MLLFQKYHYWIINYLYPNSASYGKFAGLSGQFFAELYQFGETLVGYSIETNDFSELHNKYFCGQLEGTLRGNQLDFKKTYYSPELPHTNFFTSKVNFQKGEIKGRWFCPVEWLSNIPEGTFEMKIEEGEFLEFEF